MNPAPAGSEVVAKLMEEHQNAEYADAGCNGA
jgi:hypothetical protein